MFPIVALTNVEGTNHFVSLDSAGNVKIWDYKKFGCLQSFSIETDDEKHKFHAQCLTYIPKPLKLVFSGRNLNIYDYDKNYNPNTVDDSVVVGIGYRPCNNTIITPAGNKIKVWNALNGEVKKIFSDISHSSEVTCFTLDHNKKRCLIGFSDGEAAVFNVQNGAKLKNLNRHNAEINFIMEMYDPNPDHNQIITASISENLIKFHLDNDLNESELIRKIDIRDSTEMRDSSLSAISYRPGKGDKFMKLFFVGTHSGFVGFFEAETTKNLGQCFPFPGEEITAIMPHHELDYIIVSTSGGKVGLIACPPLPYRFQVVWSFSNMDPESKLPNYINNSIWSNRKRYLFISDEKFYIRCYDLSKPIEELIQDRKEKLKKDNSSNSKNHLYAPTISKDSPPCLWITKAHSDPIRVMEYIEDEDLICTSGIDKKVKIFNSMNGKFIESLQQKYDKFEPIPIAYKKPGIEGTWHPNLYERVDKDYVNKKKLEEMMHQEQASENPFTKLIQRTMMEQQQKEQKLNRSASKANYNSQRNLKSNPKQTPQIQGMSKNEEIAIMGADKDPRGELHRAASKILINHLLNNTSSAETDKDKIMEEVEREESDPYFNFIQIEHSMLASSNSSYWKLKVDFDTERREVEKRLREVKH
jgi:WD40 repeat protein